MPSMRMDVAQELEQAVQSARDSLEEQIRRLVKDAEQIVYAADELDGRTMSELAASAAAVLVGEIDTKPVSRASNEKSSLQFLTSVEVNINNCGGRHFVYGNQTSLGFKEGRYRVWVLMLPIESR